MAKTSKIAKNEQRKRIVALYAERRAELKRIIAAPTTPVADREAAQLKLQKLPRDASPIRVRNRDAADGRPRGYLRKAGISRVRFRTMAHRGELPGITKSSW
ncbi:30S ribosomal protein S14 [Kribbella sandramycini]|uniref:Small ribosomal subunit protein uS14 n=1 Tax=Kribbella sandramycini TaxID=60450 RepID=A0A7Y4KZI4_9ACTN|nr:30S ribosomal protein S14 [Kribbella sandramycini]MBB6565250.1 small subunit ribosomal protein S14 [Kribbella sandramycini]NOL41519.1 30S ribosomal protein S14 [Kribbella sandramycini]